LRFAAEGSVVGSKRVRGVRRELIDAAIGHRRGPTRAEAALWAKLRDRQLGALKFRRQYPVGPYILDFYSAEARLAVELDGSSHDEKQDYDEYRDAHLAQYGLRVIRFRNGTVLGDIQTVLDAILECAHARPIEALSEGPSPRIGRGGRG
jgi:very-short-patch-repair endonuclease